MGTLENKLIWSNSRINTLNFCARQYYFSYYQSWSGWEWSASPETKKTYMLKNRQNIKEWIGDQTHEAIKTYLLATDPDEEAIKKDILQKMDLDFAKSQKKTYLTPYGKPKDFGLIEHYWGQEIPESEFMGIKGKVIDSFEAFLQCKYLQGILEVKKLNDNQRLFEVDPGQDFDKMKVNVAELNNTIIYALPDLYYKLRNNEYLILDWKTGEYKKEGEIPSFQLLAYGLRLQNEINDKKNKVEALEIYLPNFTEVGGILNPDHMVKIVTRIEEDLKKMKSYLLNAEINTPKEKDFFEKTESKKKCDVCQFKELCGGE